MNQTPFVDSLSLEVEFLPVPPPPPPPPPFFNHFLQRIIIIVLSFVDVAWWSIDRESDVSYRPAWVNEWLAKDWGQLAPWVETPFAVSNVSSKFLGTGEPGGFGRTLVFISDDDPYTVDAQKNKKDWEEKLPEAQVIICPGQKHFNESTLPAEVVDKIFNATRKIKYSPSEVKEV